MKIKLKSQSTIKMDKGYYRRASSLGLGNSGVAIHNKNGQGLLLMGFFNLIVIGYLVAIHNKNGQGLLRTVTVAVRMTKFGVAIHNKNG